MYTVLRWVTCFLGKHPRSGLRLPGYWILLFSIKMKSSHKFFMPSYNCKLAMYQYQGVRNSLEISYRLPEILWNLWISTNFEIWNLLQFARFSVYLRLQIRKSSIMGVDQWLDTTCVGRMVLYVAKTVGFACTEGWVKQSIMHNLITIRDVKNKVTSCWRLYRVATCAKYSGGSKFFMRQIILTFSCKVSDHRSDFLI